jgi:hypothetical protein
LTIAPARQEDPDLSNATFCCPELDSFCLLDRLGLSATGQQVHDDHAVLECRVVRPDDWRRPQPENGPRPQPQATEPRSRKIEADTGAVRDERDAAVAASPHHAT